MIEPSVDIAVKLGAELPSNCSPLLPVTPELLVSPDERKAINIPIIKAAPIITKSLGKKLLCVFFSNIV